MSVDEVIPVKYTVTYQINTTPPVWCHGTWSRHETHATHYLVPKVRWERARAAERFVDDGGEGGNDGDV